MTSYRNTIVWFIVIVAFFTHVLYALPILTIEDEIVMSQLVRNSYSIDELRLCLKLFPESPFQSEFKKRLFKLEMSQKSYSERQKYAELEKYDLDVKLDHTLTADDDMAMSRLLEHSFDPKALHLFIKLFPGSAFRPVFENRLKNIELSKKVALSGTEVSTIGIEEDADVFQDNEEEIIVANDEKVNQEEQAKPAEVEKEASKTQEPEKEKQPEKEEPEEDWSKIDFGIPTQIDITDNSGNSQTTDGSPLGLYLGWSTEYMFDTGWGGGTYYLAQKLKSSGAERQHLFFEAQVKGLIIDQISWGIGWGTGITTAYWPDKPSGMEIVPGTGTIQSLSLGYKYRSFGINYAMVIFTGSYQWTIISGANTTRGETEWKGSMNMFTLDYYF